MAMGNRNREAQQAFWIPTEDLPRSPGHPFFERVNALLDAAGFDRLVEERCRRFYADRMGRGQALRRKRGMLVERSFADCYDTGGMRRTHLKQHDNILKRLLIHVAGFNLGLMLRRLFGVGTARGMQDLATRLWARIVALQTALAGANSQRGADMPFRRPPHRSQPLAA